ncbi:MAG: efflux transporter outer membrane subunit [Proteobacteria bacterium]|nr:efflux transporter outer membrane subunit [Pseudomonadota bacterium]
MKRLQLTAMAAASMLLGGCMNLAPTYERPAAPVAAAYPADALPGSGAAAVDVAWQSFFADARLRRLIELALAANRDLRVAVLNIEQARALYDVKRADQLPSLGLGASAQRGPGTTGIVNTYAVGLAVSSFELDLFGRVKNLGAAALAQYFATAETRKAVQISLIASVADAYVAMLADEELLRVTRETLKTREDTTRLTKLRFDRGAASEIDYRQAEQLLEGAKVVQAQTERQRLQDENALVLLIGRPLPSDLPPGLPLAGQQLRADLPAGLPSDLLERRPDVRSAEQQLLSANANIGAARAAFFPRITLTGNAGTASLELSGLFKGGSYALTGTASLLQPIFDAGRNQADLEVAKVDRDLAVAQYEKAIQTAFREVADALAGRSTLTEQLRAQTAQTAAAQAAYRLADLRYRSGVTSYLDLLDTQRTLFAAQQATVQTQALEVQNRIALYKVLGGGWTEPPPPATAAN